MTPFSRITAATLPAYSPAMARLRILAVALAALLVSGCAELPQRSAERPLRVLHWNAGTAREAIASGEWDAVVMQQGPSALPESQANLREWAGRFADAARARGARPALLTVWPEGYRSNVFPDVISSYRNAAAAAKAELYPAGAAWQAAWRRDRSLPLYGPDGFHPSALGTYLTGIVVLAGLTGTAPVGLPVQIDRPGFVLRLSASRARLLRDAAAEALRAR